MTVKHVLAMIVGMLAGFAVGVLMQAQAAHAAYSGGFSSGSVHSSYTPPHYTSVPSYRPSYSGGLSGGSVHSSGSYTGGTKSVSSGGLSAPVRSTGSYTPPKPASVPVKAPVVLTQHTDLPASKTTVVHEYSYNPFSGNFFFWYWMFGGFNHPRTQPFASVVPGIATSTLQFDATSTINVTGK